MAAGDTTVGIGPIPCGHGDLPGYGPGYGMTIVGDHAMPVQPWSELMCTWLEPFRSCFTGPTFRHVLVLVTGALLTPARRTITAMLSVVGLSQAPTFTNYHRVLNRNRWSSRKVARRLLRLLVTAFMPAGPVIIALDDTLERRWGARIKARGIYRDPVRSSVIRSAPLMATSSKLPDCAGCRSCCWHLSRGLSGSGLSPSSPC